MSRSIFSEGLAQAGRSDISPVLVEGVARLEHGTLGHLSRDQLLQEARVTIEMVDEVGLAFVQRIARSFGLPVDQA